MSIFKKSYKKFFCLKNKKNSSFIIKDFAKKDITLYNGKENIIVNIRNEMVGFRFGEFILTRKPFNFPKKKLKK